MIQLLDTTEVSPTRTQRSLETILAADVSSDSRLLHHDEITHAILAIA